MWPSVLPIQASYFYLCQEISFISSGTSETHKTFTTNKACGPASRHRTALGFPGEQPVNRVSYSLKWEGPQKSRGHHQRGRRGRKAPTGGGYGGNWTRCTQSVRWARGAGKGRSLGVSCTPGRMIRPPGEEDWEIRSRSAWLATRCRLSTGPGSPEEPRWAGGWTPGL